MDSPTDVSGIYGKRHSVRIIPVTRRDPPGLPDAGIRKSNKAFPQPALSFLHSAGCHKPEDARHAGVTHADPRRRPGTIRANRPDVIAIGT
ncbi:MAG: hypothetical protein ACRYGL_01325 [Janthinobacterium lividum]